MSRSEAIGDEDHDGLATVSGGAVADAEARAEVIDQKEADRVRIRVIQLRDQMSEGYFEMGRLLHRISKQGLYAQWCRPDGQRYDSFGEYVEHEVEFKLRKAKNLMSIWWWFAEKLNDPALAEKVKDIGWTKASALVGVVNTNNADAWIERAKGLKLKELESETRMALEKAGKQRPSRPTARSKSSGSSSSSSAAPDASSGTDGDGEPAEAEHEQPEPQEDVGVDPLSDDEVESHRTRWTVMMDGPQRTNVEQAIDRASEIAEVEADSKGFLLDFIATSFLALHSGAGGNSRDRRVNMRNDILMAVQRSLGIDIVAFEAGTSHAIFGESTINRVAAEAADGD